MTTNPIGPGSMKITQINKDLFQKVAVSIIVAGLSLAVTAYPLNAAGSARDFLKAGVKAVESKQYDIAVKHLTKAINLATLSPKLVAKALHQRGVAYNMKGEPARGIADLTRALFFKKISPEQKTKILKARAASYKSVGLVSKAQADLRSAGLGTTQSVSNITLPKKPTLKPVVTQNIRQQIPQLNNKIETTTGWGVSVSEEQKTQPTRVARIEQPRQANTNRPLEKVEKPVAEEKNNSFSSFFSRNSEPKRQPEKPTAQVNWGKSTQVSSTNTSQKRSNPATFRSANYTIPTAGNGRYRLQLAAVSSENDAQQAWFRLQSRYSSLLSNQTPDFQRVDLGSGRSVVRIQIGPFADRSQTMQLCNSYKEQGLDCFLVVR